MASTAAPARRPGARAAVEPLAVAAPLPGDGTLYFKLVRVVNETARPFTETLSRRHRLTLNEWRAMVALASRPGIAAHELAARIGLDKMSVSRAVAGLARERRVLKQPDPADARRTLLRLSRSGEALYRTIGEKGARRAEALFRHVGAREKAAMEATLDKLLRALAEEAQLGSDGNP